jgi:hypothetical protein
MLGPAPLTIVPLGPAAIFQPAWSVTATPPPAEPVVPGLESVVVAGVLVFVVAVVEPEAVVVPLGGELVVPAGHVVPGASSACRPPDV